MASELLNCPACGEQKAIGRNPSGVGMCYRCGCEWLESEVRWIRRDRARLLDALSRYGRHESDCEQTLSSEIIVPCSCGFAAIAEAGEVAP